MEWIMDKMVMDAMNNGWALGLATRVRAVDADVEAARERVGLAARPARPARLEWPLLLAAIGPMARARH
jgi:hypothetical protein